MERILKVDITPELDGCEVGYVIKNKFALSHRLLADLKNGGGIMLDSSKVTVRHKVHTGNTLELVIRDEISSERIVPVALDIDIIYEDEDILALNKPKDMPVHPSINNYDNTLANAVMYYYSGEEFVFRPITRLDRDTTGVVIVAKNKFSAQSLSDSMKHGRFSKTYIALLSDIPEKPEGIVDAPISREGESVIKRCVSDDGKAALTKYRVIKHLDDGRCVAKVIPVTGRTHQIRVHMAHIGCPLKYDYMYGEETEGKTLYLHCASVTFPHPCDGRVMKISCLADDFDGVDLESIKDKIFVDKESYL